MLHFVVNPVSRSGRGLRLWQRKIEPLLKKRGIPYDVRFSKERGDVTRICLDVSSKAAAEDECTIVILGGDGTVNDAVQGIADFDHTTLAYIPTGSSNDFARDMKIPRNAKRCMKRILSGNEPDKIDLGQVSANGKSRLFAVSSGLGFDAAVCQKSSHSRVKKTLNKVGLGALTYLAIALNQLISAPKTDCMATMGQARLFLPRFLFAAAMIHRFEGGGFMFCPKADCRDGKLDFCMVNKKTLAGILFALPTAFFGLHGIFPGITLSQGESLELTSTVPLWLHTDGEVMQKATRVSFRVAPKKLKLLGGPPRAKR